MQNTSDATTGGRSCAANYIEALFFQYGFGGATCKGHARDPEMFDPGISRWIVIEHPIAVGTHSRPSLYPLVFDESLGRGFIKGLSKDIVGSIAIGKKQHGSAVGCPVGRLVIKVVEGKPSRSGEHFAILLKVSDVYITLRVAFEKNQAFSVGCGAEIRDPGIFPLHKCVSAAR